LADLPDRTVAARPEARRLDALRARIEAELRLGRAHDLVPELQELGQAHPYDEPLQAQLIRALRDSGRGADALAAYENARRTLAEGLGTDPGPELLALHAELLAGGGSGSGSWAGVGAGVEQEALPQATYSQGAYSGAVDPTSSGSQAPPVTPAPQPTSRPDHPSTSPPDHPSASRPDHPTNLRPRLTSFVGREPELAAIRSDLQRARLVTLTGPGGSGKTRLAEETAAGHLQPAWLAELAPLDRAEAVPGAVVSALGLRETVLMTSELSLPQGDPSALLIEYCAPRGLLLVLDNCEHVIGAAARLAETLLTHCPELRILATSREPLGVPGELVRPVDPLPDAPAHRLFAERAAAVRPGFDPAEDPEAIAEICTRLDGLPLAIELAAARLRLLTPRQIADRLDDRFRLLTSGSRTVLPRQQTLQAVVDWSWDLLDEHERAMLCEVSVFAGGWDLAAAEAVCGGGPGRAAELIGALVDKSLIVAAPARDPLGSGREGGGTGRNIGMRYRLLETIHEYATERAADVPEIRDAARRRHGDHFLALVEKAEPLLRSADQLPWIRALESDLDNIRATLQRFIESADEERGTALSLGIGWFWWLRNYRKEGAKWMERVLRLGTDPEGPDAESDPRYWPRMHLHMGQMFLLSESGPLSELTGPERREQLVRLRAAFARPVPEAARFPGILWPFISYVLDSSESVHDGLDRAVDTCRRFGGPWELGVTLMFRTHAAVDRIGGMPGVDDDLAELRVLSRQVGDRWMRAQVCSAAGEAAMARGQYAAAQAEYEEALQLAYEVGAFAEAPFLIARLAEIAYRSGDREVAERALAEAEAEANRYGTPDAQGFICLMMAQMALERGEVALAGEQLRAAVVHARRGTPPPQFNAMLANLDAQVAMHETGSRDALAKAREGLRIALDGECAEVITAAIAETVATLLSAAGDPARAARVLA
ncbi:BTAD domain-containing putative transcriptional regulator, partial [Streptomyces sp. T-3]|nr:BTAD domain-containing putative transcriptional regulator [Streptomyces sp. T-3]